MKVFPFLKENIEYLQRKGNPIMQWFSTQSYEQDTLINKLFVNARGLRDWRLPNGKGMFEVLPPHGLYNSWIDKEKIDTSATFVVGSNLGYGINHLLTNTPDSHKIMLLEPNPDMLLACLSQTDYRPYFRNKKLHIMVPNEQFINEVIRNLDLQFVYGKIHLKGDLPSQQLGPEYARWATIIQHKMENFSLELSTMRHRQDIMVGNEIENFSRAMSDGSLKSIEGKAKGVGAVILGAGPSMEVMAPRLRKNPGHVLYTCALQTVAPLQKLGLFVPHQVG